MLFEYFSIKSALRTVCVMVVVAGCSLAHASDSAGDDPALATKASELANESTSDVGGPGAGQQDSQASSKSGLPADDGAKPGGALSMIAEKLSGSSFSALLEDWKDGARSNQKIPAVFWLFCVLVFLFSVHRFNTLAVKVEPLDVCGPTRVYTSFARYWVFAALFGIISILVYSILLLCIGNPALSDALKSALGELQLSLPKGEVSGKIPEVWAASLLTFLLPSIPWLKRVEEEVRRSLQGYAHAPASARSLAKSLREREVVFSHRECLERAQSELFEKAERSEREMRRLVASQTALRKLLELMYVRERLEVWHHQDFQFKRYSDMCEQDWRSITDEFDQLIRTAGKLDEPVHDQSNTVTEQQIDLLRDRLYRFVSSGVLYCSVSESARCHRLDMLGLGESGASEQFDWLSLVYTLFVTLCLSLASAAVLRAALPIDVADGENFIWSLMTEALQVSIIHTAAIAASVWVWPTLIRRLPHDSRLGRPWTSRRLPLELVAGWLVGGFVFSVIGVFSGSGLLSQKEPHLLILGAVIVGIPTGAAAVSFTWLSMDTVERRGRRLIDAMVQGTVTCCFSLIAFWLARFPATLKSHLPAILQDANAWWVVGVVTFIVGWAIGLYLPYRRRVRHERNSEISDWERRADDRPKVAVIGAGIAGLTCAHELAQQGFAVRVFDKAVRAGGRLRSSERDGLTMDMGVQSVTPRTPSFVAQVMRWCRAGLLQPWSRTVQFVSGGAEEIDNRGLTTYVGTPQMGTLIDWLAASFGAVSIDCEVSRIQRVKDGWNVYEQGKDRRHGTFRYLVLAVPPEVATGLLGVDQALEWELHRYKTAPLWSVAFVFDEPLRPAQGAGPRPSEFRFKASPILQSAVCLSDKPVSGSVFRRLSSTKQAREVWVLHTNRSWQRNAERDDREAVIKEVLAEFWRLTDFDERPKPVSEYARWWPHAVVKARPEVSDNAETEPAVSLFDENLGVCGDWCASSGIECAWRSGRALSQQIAGHWRQFQNRDLFEIPDESVDETPEIGTGLSPVRALAQS